MVAAGAGGPLTGRGADLLIVDDPIKNAEQAVSERIREKQWDWWQSRTSLPTEILRKTGVNRSANASKLSLDPR
jgi:hypothetical protein